MLTMNAQLYSSKAILNGPLLPPALPAEISTSQHSSSFNSHDLSVESFNPHIVTKNAPKPLSTVRSWLQGHLNLILYTPIISLTSIICLTTFTDHFDKLTNLHTIPGKMLVAGVISSIILTKKLLGMCNLIPQSKHFAALACSKKISIHLVRNLDKLPADGRSALKCICLDALRSLIAICDLVDADPHLHRIGCITMRSPMLCVFHRQSGTYRFNTKFMALLESLPISNIGIHKLSLFEKLLYRTENLIRCYRSTNKPYLGYCELNISTAQLRMRLRAGCETMLNSGKYGA
jgi:hypothetical protein